jgi:ferredoxin
VAVSYLDEAGLRELFGALAERGFRIVGPTVRDGAIVYDEVASADDLPAGWSDEQAPGSYRLKRRDDSARFGYAVGPHSWKRFLFPPTRRLWRARTGGPGYLLEILPEPEDATRYAFVGVRSCELHAIAIQDRVLMQGAYPDPAYASLRERAFLVAVNCAQAGGTCFCVSMNTGPRCSSGYDLVLTEIVQGGRPGYVTRSGSERGAEVLAGISRREATADEIHAAGAAVERTAASMGRRMDTDGIRDLLSRNLEHPRWDEVAARCLSCGNCTLACPTCFCTGVEDRTDLACGEAERLRHWDSCFTMDFSFVHGGSVRATTRSRYRQWMTHKLATWIDQFGSSGCVGCGRCITWCPVGIDITEEARAIRDGERAKA